MPRTAKDIKKDVVDQLCWDSRIDASRIKVEVVDSKIVLTGQVPSYSARWIAEKDAWIVAGSASIDNKIEISHPRDTQTLSDESLRSNIESMFMWNPVIDSTKIKVIVAEGVVTLEGSVEAYWKKMRVEELASEVKGVRGIVNRLAVVPTRELIDEVIAKDITYALSRTRSLDVADVDVLVEHGVVTLTGSVPNALAFQAAGNCAAHAKGVLNVKNKLTVKA